MSDAIARLSHVWGMPYSRLDDFHRALTKAKAIPHRSPGRGTAHVSADAILKLVSVACFSPGPAAAAARLEEILAAEPDQMPDRFACAPAHILSGSFIGCFEGLVRYWSVGERWNARSITFDHFARSIEIDWAMAVANEPGQMPNYKDTFTTFLLPRERIRDYAQQYFAGSDFQTTIRIQHPTISLLKEIIRDGEQ